MTHKFSPKALTSWYNPSDTIQASSPSILLDGVYIELVSSAKNLGVTYDSNLTFEAHINSSPELLFVSCPRSSWYRLNSCFNSCTRYAFGIKSEPISHVRNSILVCEQLNVSSQNFDDKITPGLKSKRLATQPLKSCRSLT